MPAPDELHIRRDPDHPGYTQKVICPYDWITLRNAPPGCKPCQINPGAIAREISRQGVITCIGPWCAIYPCQRVRECAGLEP